jgi:Ca-activated chloride channel family protein
LADYYTTLGLTYDATAEEIRSAFFDLARKYHPDTSQESPVVAKEKFVLIQEAYEVLSNLTRRQSYDSRLPAELRNGPEISVNVKYSRSVVPIISEPQLHYVLVDMICTADLEFTKLPPFHLCLVLDKSTSMQGTRMDMVKATAAQLVRQFRPQDLFSVVTFSDRAEILIPPTRVADIKEDHRINMLQPSGGTEIYQGLALGVQQLRSVDDRYLRQLVLLTDGHTYGDDEACLELAQLVANDGISINVMGIGHEWNDQLLDRVASLSGGNAMLITSPKDLGKFLEQKLSMLSNTYARGLSFDFVSDPGVQLRYAFRLHPETGVLPSSSPAQLGTLMYRRSMSFLLEFLLPPIAASTQSIALANGQIRMEIPSLKSARARIMLDLSRPVNTTVERESPPPPLVEAMAKLTLYRMQERVRKEVSEGHIDKATRHLHYLATHLLSQGDRELAHTVLIEAEHIQQSRRFSKEGDKRIKYGTRALLLPSGPEQKP